MGTGRASRAGSYLLPKEHSVPGLYGVPIMVIISDVAMFMVITVIGTVRYVFG